MDKKKRNQLLLQIGDIFDHICDPCKKEQMKAESIKRDCSTCKHDVMLKELGKKLESGKKRKPKPIDKVEVFGQETKQVNKKTRREEVFEILDQNYEKLINKGLSENLIRKRFGMSAKLMSVWKEERGISIKNGRLSNVLKGEQNTLNESKALTVEEYQQRKEKGQTDKQIREEFRMNHNQLHGFKKENNLIGKFDARKNNSVPTNEKHENNPINSGAPKVIAYEKHAEFKKEMEWMLLEECNIIDKLREKVKKLEEKSGSDYELKKQQEQLLAANDELRSENRDLKQQLQDITFRVKCLEEENRLAKKMLMLEFGKHVQ